MARKKATKPEGQVMYKVKLKDGHTGVILKNKMILAHDGYAIVTAEELEQLKSMEVIC